MQKLLILLALLPVCSTVGAVELTPFVGYRWGGELEAGDNTLFDVNVDIDESDAIGMSIEIPVALGLSVEIRGVQQETDFIQNQPLFGEDAVIAGVQLDYYHAGVSWQWKIGDVRPYVAGGLGVARIDPEGGSSEDRFSVTFGGGVKLDVLEWLGFRFEGRGYVTNIDDNFDGDDCCFERYDDNIVQGEVNVGMVFSF
jgi:opacity protein-like surface antigen